MLSFAMLLRADESPMLSVPVWSGPRHLVRNGPERGIGRCTVDSCLY
ncbi:hypothetical protein I547_6525 [Mycobacterium kansasii 824]|uniref:Uncharacterized protein n=1 Tax=Mycobacterium kansasii TaxID=1768 RepID=A0A1V3XEP8_MYCKA|nr:hypothetical protein I547_6525 [Mycobacterium kansasii 824]OOK66442.1 hypothetical protein BZL30_8257 [Mycobacterium kansasii]OOK77216.1 hypothetical protein BZL29_3227 [Mycobacterium kansasii]